MQFGPNGVNWLECREATGPTIHLCLVDVLNFWKHPKVDNLSTRPLFGESFGVLGGTNKAQIEGHPLPSRNSLNGTRVSKIPGNLRGVAQHWHIPSMDLDEPIVYPRPGSWKRSWRIRPNPSTSYDQDQHGHYGNLTLDLPENFRLGGLR